MPISSVMLPGSDGPQNARVPASRARAKFTGPPPSLPLACHTVAVLGRRCNWQVHELDGERPDVGHPNLCAKLSDLCPAHGVDFAAACRLCMLSRAEARSGWCCVDARENDADFHSSFLGGRSKRLHQVFHYSPLD